jgi:hypothetical protein
VKKINYVILFYSVFFILIVIPMMSTVFGQDIAELASEKYLLQVDDKVFQIFYGFKGSLEMETVGKEIVNPKVSSMNINSERSSAEGGKFQVLVDNKEKTYELTYYPDKVAIGFIFPAKSSHVEIIGSSVIPEFTTTIIIFGIAMLTICYFLRKNFKILLNC